MKLINSKTHGMIDYAVAPSLIALPYLAKWPGGLKRLLTAVGIFTLIYSMFTKYELGVFKILPYKGHLAIDTAVAAGTVAAPVLFTETDSKISTTMVAMGLAEVAIIALSLISFKPRSR